MKKYIVFAYDHYYPCGGFNDIHDSYDTAEETIEALDNMLGYDVVYVVDRDTWDKVDIHSQ